MSTRSGDDGDQTDQRVKRDKDAICRVCMTEDPQAELISLFQINGTGDEVIANMIIDCCEVMVSDDDNMPQNICADCLDRLNQAYELRKQCKRSDQVLRGLVGDEPVEDVPDDASVMELEVEYLDEEDEPEESSPNPKFVESVEDFPLHRVYRLLGEQCCSCFELFQDVDALMAHCDQEHGRGTPGKSHFQCDVCRDPFDSHAALTKHKEVAAGMVLYHCKRCQVDLRSEREFLKHVVTSERDHEDAVETLDVAGRFEEILIVGMRCCGCDEIYDDQVELERHREDAHRSSRVEGSGFECDGCYRRFKISFQLAKHRAEARAKQWFVCSAESCQFRTVSRKSMIGHMIRDHESSSKKPDSGYACCVLRCFETFQTYEDLEFHADEAHALVRLQHEQDRNAEHNVTCDICHRGFPDERTYSRHRNDKTRKHICKTCGVQYAFRANLIEHERSNCGQVARYKCSQCDKAYKTPGGLKNHRKTHKDQRSFVCELCGRAFLRKGILKDHMNTVHSTVRAFQCSLCPKSFTSRNIYRSHQLTHTKEKPFQCRHCDKRYLKSSDRKMHENQVHLGNRPFRCQYCPATFTRDRERRLHERVHTKAKLYTCEECGEGYNKFAAFKDHRRKQHGLDTMRDLGPAAMAAVQGQDDEEQFEFLSVDPEEEVDCDDE
uniref:Zinc finger protein 26 n=1 Tax=Culex pipiens TaxID=7175 RepID=A0A8D8HNK6_CULPI